MSGKRKQLLIIGKAKSLRALKRVNNFPVKYYANTKAWMTTAIVNKWLIKWNDALDHNILLLTDRPNCSLQHTMIVYC